MKKMILWTLVLFTPLLWTTSVHAIFGLPDVAALAQRVTIIANQGIQITHAVTGLSRMTEQFNKLKEQYDHLQQQALGEIGALTAPLSELAALPGTLVADGLAWRADFTNPTTAGLIDALDLFSTDGTPLTDYWRGRLNAAPDVTEADVLAEYANLPASLADRAAENYRRQRNHGEQRTALNQTVNTAASSAAATVQSALDSYAELRGQTNTSGTALGQAQIAGPHHERRSVRRLTATASPRGDRGRSPAARRRATSAANARRRAWQPFAPRAPSMTAAWPASRDTATAASACCFTSTSTGAPKP